MGITTGSNLSIVINYIVKSITIIICVSIIPIMIAIILIIDCIVSNRHIIG
jgi:hypothetical protein